VGLDGQKKWAKIPVPQTPTAELDGDDITNRLVVAVIDVVNSSGVAGLSMLRVCRVAGVTTGAGKPRFEDTDDLLMASFDAFINNVVSNNIMTVAKKSSVLGLVDLYAEFIIAGLSSSRKRWFRFRQEIYLASKTNLLVRRKIKKTVSLADQQLEKLLMSDAYKLDKKQVATILGLNQILSVGMPALFSLGLPVDKIDHRIPLRWIFS
jgi:DNA-binding transcriptional regulator YbjK